MNEPSTPPPAVWIVIVNYDSSHLVRRFITPELMSAFAGCVIVENGSSREGEVEALRSLGPATGNVVIIKSAKNRGFGAGVNLGVTSIPSADWDGVWVLNPDLLVGVEAAHTMLDALQSSTRPTVFSPLILKPDQSVWFRGGHVDTAIGASVHWGFGQEAPAQLSPQTDTGFVSGAAPLISREAWNMLGGFREDLFLYWEDADLSLRATELGINLRIVSAATIVHEEGGSSGSNGRGTHYHFYMQRNRLVVCAPHSSRLRLVLSPRAVLEWGRLLYRAAREPENSAIKLAASARGLGAGMRSGGK